jgi:hypothetical protein
MPRGSVCPQAAPLCYPWVYHEVLGIPEHMRALLALPIGYPLVYAPVNRFHCSRANTEEVLHGAGGDAVALRAAQGRLNSGSCPTTIG